MADDEYEKSFLVRLTAHEHDLLKAQAKVEHRSMQSVVRLAILERCGDETDFWLSIPGGEESLARSKADVAAGRTYTTEQVRAWVAAGMPDGPLGPNA